MAKKADAWDDERLSSAEPGDNAAAEGEPDGEAVAKSSVATGDGAPSPTSDHAGADEAEDLIESLRAALADAQAALEESRAEAESSKDQALRAVAEADNVRKRADRSIESAHKYALERFVSDLLPAVDSFERAVDAAADLTASGGEAVSSMAEGMELSLKLLMEAMQRQGIEVVDPIGAPFDPNLHEAMSMIENPEAEPGSVIEVFQKGYTVNGRLARPARVIIAKEPAPQPSKKA
ncbi:MAG: nucleotide exchange factor GrpE [Gammaproteobacteria bacterium]|nr:nucleotide exchange factor GrpE [Gammaproteobacteria bacterium]